MKESILDIYDYYNERKDPKAAMSVEIHNLRVKTEILEIQKKSSQWLLKTLCEMKPEFCLESEGNDIFELLSNAAKKTRCTLSGEFYYGDLDSVHDIEKDINNIQESLKIVLEEIKQGHKDVSQRLVNEYGEKNG